MHELACDHWDSPDLDGFFGRGTPEAIRNNKLKFFENRLLSYATDLTQWLQSDKAREYLHRGFIIRHMMMQRSRVHVRQETIDRREPLDPYLAADLATHLNAYYLNLVGALDNIAWAIAFEFNLDDSVDEDSWESRRFCTLSSTRFRAALGEFRPVVASRLNVIAKWLEEVKQFRDPAAHRLPLVLVSAMLTPDDAERHAELSRMANEALLSEDLNRWGQLVGERELLGRFLPVLAAQRGPAGEFIAAPNQMAMDQEEFVKAASFLMSRCFSNGSKQR